MPENLTTWKIRAWSMAQGTKVGEADVDVVTTKDLLVRSSPAVLCADGRSGPLGQRA